MYAFLFGFLWKKVFDRIVIFIQVEMVEETEYDEEITCDHSYNRR